MIDVKKIRADFPMLRSNKKMQGHDLIWLDNASTTFKPDAVIEAINRYYKEETSNSHRGDYDLCYQMDQEVALAGRGACRSGETDLPVIADPGVSCRADRKRQQRALLSDA